MHDFKDSVDLEYFGIKEDLKLKEPILQLHIKEEQNEISTDEKLETDGLKVKWMNTSKQVPYESAIKTFRNASKLCPITAKVTEFCEFIILLLQYLFFYRSFF